jgi:hypothetical protein
MALIAARHPVKKSGLRRRQPSLYLVAFVGADAGKRRPEKLRDTPSGWRAALVR